MKANTLQVVEDPSICVVRISQGAMIEGRLAELLNPVDPRTFHRFRLPAKSAVELHYHEYDEYWWFVEGRPRVTLRGTSGVTKSFDLVPGDLVACVRGVQHTLWADHDLVYFQYNSVLTGGEFMGHLRRIEPADAAAATSSESTDNGNLRKAKAAL